MSISIGCPGSVIAWIEAHRLDRSEEQHDATRPLAGGARALLHQPDDVLPRFDRIQRSREMGHRLTVSDELDLGVAASPVVPATKVVTGLDPERLPIVQDAEDRVVGVPLRVDRPEHSGSAALGLKGGDHPIEGQSQTHVGGARTGWEIKPAHVM